MATQARVVLKIPARIVGAGNISVTLENGIYIISDAPPAVSTVAKLPPAAGMLGVRRYVSNAMGTAFGSVVTGGGTNTVPVWSDGTQWRIG